MTPQPEVRKAELEAHEYAVVTPLPDLVAWLRWALSPRLVAFIAGVDATGTTHAWAGRTEPVPVDVEQRLRDAAWATRADNPSSGERRPGPTIVVSSAYTVSTVTPSPTVDDRPDQGSANVPPRPARLSPSSAGTSRPRICAARPTS